MIEFKIGSGAARQSPFVSNAVRNTLGKTRKLKVPKSAGNRLTGPFSTYDVSLVWTHIYRRINSLRSRVGARFESR